MDLHNFIKEKRKNLKNSSINTYVSILTNLHKKMRPDSEFSLTLFFESPKTVLEYLKDKYQASQRKTILAALVILTNDNEKVADMYREQMILDKQNYEKIIDENKRNKKQEENYLSQEEIKQIYNKYENIARSVWNLKDLNKTQILSINDFVILSVLSGVFIPPRRLLDFSEMKIRNFDKDKDNYYFEGSFVFNQYKTSKFYGEQKVGVPKPLRNIINKWMTINDTDYLILNSRFDKISQSSLNKKINELLGRSIGVDGLRSSYLSEKYKDMPVLKEMKQLAHDLGHDLSTSFTYVKKD